jgi:hypothetical protein
MNTFAYISSFARYILGMTRSFIDMINITIGWEWALGIFGLLLLIAWRGSARFTALETSMEWVKEILRDLKVGVDNATGAAPAFGAGSPIDLKPVGVEWLEQSGMKAYIDKNKTDLMARCEEKRTTNPYEVQKHIFATFDTLTFPNEVDDKLKKFAFEKGSTMAVVRRVGALYLRNLCLTRLCLRPTRRVSAVAPIAGS